MTTHYEDVLAFHDKMDIPRALVPTPLHLTPSGFERLRHLREELDEYDRAADRGDVAGQADALVDLVYVAIGNAIAQGFPWDELWAEVHAANLRKERDPSLAKRVRKPAGWQPPDVAGILAEAAGDLA